MNKKTGIGVLFYVTAIGLFGQQPASTRNFLQNQYMLQRMSTPDQLIMGNVQTLPMAPPDVRGSDLLNRTYNKCIFLLTDSSVLTRVPARYFILRNEFELITPQGIRVLKGDRVKSFVWEDSLYKHVQVFVNMQQYQGENQAPGTGFMQILSEGSIGLLKHTEVVFKEANYHVALNVGSPDHEFIYKTQLYFLKGNTFYRLPPRKKVLTVFPDHQEDLQKFVKLNQLNLSIEHHLQALFDYYNNLKKGGRL